MKSDTHPQNGAADQGSDNEGGTKEKRQALLVIGVMSVTTVIVIGWLLILPFQLNKLNAMSEEEQARWDAVQQEVSSQSGDLKKAMDSMRDSYDSLEQRVNLQGSSKTEDYGGGRVPTEVIERLRAVISDINVGDDVGTVAGAESETQSETHATQDLEQ